LFTMIMGVPLHPILVHTAVVFVPLLALVSVLYALLPRLRPKIRLTLTVLAIITPIFVLFTKLSGDAFFRRRQDRHAVTPDFIPKLQAHQHFGTLTLYATVVLAVLTLALLYFVRPATADGAAASSGALGLVVRVLVVIAAIVAVYYVFRTGDSGGKIVWSGA